MKRSWKRFRRKQERGQSLVEFAFVFPIFLAVFIGLVAFALLFYSFVTLQLAVREGTSEIVHHPTEHPSPPYPNDIIQLVRNNSFSFDQSALTIVVTPTNPLDLYSGRIVEVSATYRVPMPTLSIPFPGGGTFRLGPIPITASSKMSIE